MFKPVSALVLATGVLAGASAALAQSAPVQQTPLNRVDAQATVLYTNDFESGIGDVVTLAATVASTTTSGEVISGTRSLKIDGGGTAYAQLRPVSMALQPNRSYVLDFRYRMLRTGHVGVILWAPGAGAAEYTVLGELPTSPMDGSSSWNLVVPNVTGASVLFYSVGASVTIDDLQISSQRVRLTRAELPLVKAAFPRLGDYMLLGPAAIAGLNGVDPVQAEQLAARYDMLVGSNFDHTLGSAAWVRVARQRNPNLLILPYRQSYMAQFENAGGLHALFTDGLADGWFMRSPTGARISEPAFPQNVQLDHTAFGPVVGGQTLADYTASFLARRVLGSGVWNGLLFDQAEWYTNPLLGGAAIDLNRDGVAESADAVQRAWADGFASMFKTLRRQFGYAPLMIGNAGYLSSNSSALKTMNGWIAELANPYPTTATGDWLTTATSNWYRLAGNYLQAGRDGAAPQVPLLEFTGLGLGTATGATTPNGAPMRQLSLEPRDFRRARLGLTTTLLGNGFFDYDLVDNTTPAQWFDEYAVDSTGRATTASSGKGYLGQPLGDAVETGGTTRTLFSLDFEGTAVPANVYLGPGRYTVDPAEVISGKSSYVVNKANASDFTWFVWAGNLLVPGRSYQLRADYRVLAYAPQTYSGLLGIGFTDAAGGLPTERTGSLFMQDTAGPGQQGTLRAAIKSSSTAEAVLGALFDVGTVAVDNVQLVEGAAGVWRRDFEQGIVLVNPTPDAITLTQAQVAGPLARTAIKRILGTQVASWNNGAAVTTGITIPSGDGIVLLAARVAPTALTAPTGVRAAVSAGSATLSWSGIPAYAAGYEVRYGEDPLALTRLAASGPAATVTLDNLVAGATYTVRVAPFDFRGRVGPSSTPVTFTVPGTVPASRPVFAVSGTGIAPGALVTITGSLLADSTAQLAAPYPTRAGGTRVEVDGVEVPLYSVSPGSITFIAPWELAGADAVLNVVRGTTPGIERLVPVVAGTPWVFTDAANVAVAHHQNGTAITTTAPAARGESIDLFATGLGAVTVAPDDGTAPATGWSTTTDVPPVVTIGGVVASGATATLEPGMVAVYRVRFVVPATVAPGTPAITVTVGGASSNSASIAVK